jgi:ketosteroid isomerase-like protein
MPAVTTPTISDKDIAAIRGTIGPWTEACIAADWDRLLSLCTDDVVFLPPDAPIAEGSTAAKAYLETYPDIKEFDVTFTHVEGIRDLATARGSFTITAEVEGNEMSITGKFLDTFRKQSDGTWRYSHVIWNHDHPAE